MTTRNFRNDTIMWVQQYTFEWTLGQWRNQNKNLKIKKVETEILKLGACSQSDINEGL